MPTDLPNDERRRAIKGIADTPTDPANDVEDPADAVSSVEETDDGGALVTLGDDESSAAAGNGDFQANLVLELDPSELRKLATDLIDLVEQDKRDREGRDKQYAEGIKRTGMGEDAPGGADFDGASRVCHPIMAESCIDFAARAMKELFPPSGPVKSSIPTTETDVKIDMADRKVKFMNWQATKNIAEYRSELEVLLTQLPMGGSQYKKWWYAKELNRPRCEFVAVDNMFLPYECSDFYTAQRATHRQFLTRLIFNQRIDSGLYEEPSNNIDSASAPDTSSAASASAKIEGKQDSGFNEDGVREVYEIYTWQQVKSDPLTDGESAPYIITIDAYSDEIIGFYRNWDENDKQRKKLDWVVEYKLIPWRGAYGIGLFHLIGGISGALTGALRALLDSAHINNSQSLIKLKGGKSNGGNITVNPTQIAEIEAVAGVDDIRKTIMAMPYNQPSPVLFQLLDWLTTAGKGIIATADEALQNVGDRTPVGTTLALVEQGNITYSSIHARLHHAQAKSLEILHRLNATFLDDEQTIEELGELVIKRSDFAKSMGIIPVSDPNIFSESQRFAQMQGVQQLRATLPNLPWNDTKLAHMMLKRMRIENADELLPQPQKPQNLNPVAENVAALQGTPLLALPAQNHMAHIFSHLEFATNPVFSSPMVGAKMMGMMLEHIQQHIGFYYADAMEKATHYQELQGKTPTVQLEHQLATANSRVLQIIDQQFQQIMPMLQQVQQLAQQYAPKPPQDPAIAATMQAAMAEIDRKKQLDQAKLQLQQLEIQELKPHGEQLKAMVDVVKNEQDNDMRMQTDLLKNQGDNQTKQFIAAMQQQQEQLMAQFQSQIDAGKTEQEQRHAAMLQQLQGHIDQALQGQGHIGQMVQNDQQHAQQLEQNAQQHGHALELDQQQADNAPPPAAPA
jgi:hypothetical protein